jgi:CheY-like chemotaxis protein
MKIEYRILWLDDKIDEFIEDEYIDQIKEYLEEKGFEATIITVSKADNFFAELDSSFDLILTDYHMAERTGDIIVQEIRKKSIFTEILFYTAKADLTSIDKVDRVTFLQTDKIVGSSHQKEVVEKAIFLIDLTIKKFQHIIVMRGMIMHEMSNLDAQMLKIVSTYINNNETEKQRVIDSVFNDLMMHHKMKLKQLEEIKRNNRFDKIIKDPLLFSSSQRASAIETIINLINADNFITEFKKEIIKVRNEFAHAVLMNDEKTGREYFQDKKGGVDFNEEKCINIRQNIKKHRKNLDRLWSMVQK